MADPTDLVIVGTGGLTVGGLTVGLLKWLGSRNISTLDTTLSNLASAVAGLSKEVQALREANVGIVKDIGALQEGFRLLQQRVDGQAQFWREQFEEHRKLVHDRMTQATHAMIEAGENAAKGRRR